MREGDLRGELDTAQHSLEEVQQKLGDAEGARGEVGEEVQRVQGLLDEARAALEESRASLDEARTALEESRSALATKTEDHTAAAATSEQLTAGTHYKKKRGFFLGKGEERCRFCLYILCIIWKKCVLF